MGTGKVSAWLGSSWLGSFGLWPPGVAQRRQLVVWWGLTLGAALAAGLPLVPAFGAGTRHLPNGDAAAFAPGATYLLETLRVLREPLVQGATVSGLVLLLALLFSSLSKAAILATLPEHTSIVPAWVRVRAVLPALIVSSMVTLLVQAAAFMAGYFTLTIVSKPVQSVLDEPGSDLFSLTVLGVAALVAVLLKILNDVWKAALIARPLSLMDSLAVALDVCGTYRFRVVTAWLGPAALGAAIIGCVAWLTALLDVAREGAWRVAAVALLHQATAFSLIVLRATWLRRARDLAATRLAPWEVATQPTTDLAQTDQAGTS